VIPFEALVELFTIAIEPWGLHAWYHVKPPTAHSIARIEEELGLTIPPDLIKIASRCPAYGGWLAGIGDDYDHTCHILSLNRAFHEGDELPPLPAHFVLLNHGHDGDCDCWDVRTTGANGEHPIVYIALESGRVEPAGKVFATFREYLEQFARDHAPRAHDPTKRRRATKLVQQFRFDPPDK
jgi:hypothetical protein